MPWWFYLLVTFAGIILWIVIAFIIGIGVGKVLAVNERGIIRHEKDRENE